MQFNSIYEKNHCLSTELIRLYLPAIRAYLPWAKIRNETVKKTFEKRQLSGHRANTMEVHLNGNKSKLTKVTIKTTRKIYEKTAFQTVETGK